MELTSDPSPQTDQRIAADLWHVWSAFFARFGRLTDVQRRAIPPILAGESVLVCARTAAGKTEAAIAPLIESRRRKSGVDGTPLPWTILYISPTRALVNDLYERLRGPMDMLGLRIARRTGDHRDGLTQSPHVLLTTPESFDSLLCRGMKGREVHALAHVSAVVLDEAHLLHGTNRGEQVRWLLERLRRLRAHGLREGWIRDEEVQVVCLSATVPAPEAVLAAYARGGTLIHVAGGRTIDRLVVADACPATEVVLPRVLCGEDAPAKVLVFANRRKRVDQLADELKPVLAAAGYKVRGHHGSLSQGQRESTEEAVRTATRIVVVATSTLEIGVDIGDIDLVVLDEPPPDVPALLQRIGRGNRRTDTTRVLACAGSAADVMIQDAMLAAAEDADLGPGHAGPQYAVARQQLASYIFQGADRERRRETLLSLLGNCLPVDVTEYAEDLLRHFIVEQELVETRSGIRLGEEWLEEVGRAGIHSVIEGSPGQIVQDDESGDLIAQGVRFRGGERLSIAAQPLAVKRWDDWKVEVRRDPSARAADGEWSYASKAWVMGPGQPYAVRRHLQIDHGVWPVLFDGGRSTVFHFGGAQRAAVLRLAKQEAGAREAMTINPWFLRLDGRLDDAPPWLGRIQAASLDLGIASELSRLEKDLARPKANTRLPLALRLREVRGWLHLHEEVVAIRDAAWQLCDEPVLAARLAVLARGVEKLRGSAAS